MNVSRFSFEIYTQQNKVNNPTSRTIQLNKINCSYKVNVKPMNIRKEKHIQDANMTVVEYDIKWYSERVR